MLRIIIFLVISLMSGLATAKDAFTGDWNYSIEHDVRSASTGNDNGYIFGVWCYSSAAENCAFQIAVDITCEENATIPVLINADTGATYVSASCVITKSNNKNFHFLRFDNFNQIKEISEESQWVGFAFPMASGLFKVARFSMNGSKMAIKAMSDVPSRKNMEYL